uniref:HMA domain-containing protein n=1 Tax=Nothobranchius furzeri TaxID=105023 RepID=A0A8C6NT23_NOTFU
MTLKIKVDGMRCQSCVQSIKGSIGGLSGVLHIQVSLQDSRAVIVYHPVLITQQGLRNKIQDLGFEATLMPEVQSGGGLVYWQKDLLDIPIHTVTIWIGGMTCISCVRSIESRVSQITGVKFVTVSLEEAKGTITFDPSLMKPEHLRTTIEELGFDASFGGKIHCNWLSWKTHDIFSSLHKLIRNTVWLVKIRASISHPYTVYIMGLLD